jgi:oxepin-CoA hydrolase/3-oxo-5,6-dehydrosuberyl-CoA semialdehyde dehydrogenase
MPAIIKPATATAQVTQAMVKSIVDSGLVPDGAISLICGGAGICSTSSTARTW